MGVISPMIWWIPTIFCFISAGFFIWIGIRCKDNWEEAYYFIGSAFLMLGLLELTILILDGLIKEL
jgi:hypothetical protein